MYKRNKQFIACFIFVIFIALAFVYKYKQTDQKPQVKIYLWYKMIPQEVFDSFEQETGIHVVKSFYDSNDILEAKLMTGNSGYDIVFPSFVPYAMRQAEVGIYENLDLSKLTRKDNINTYITRKFYTCSKNTSYLIPVLYTTIGILYNKTVVQKVFGTDEISYNMIFDPENLKLLQHYGVNFPSEYIDIFPQLKKYLGLNDIWNEDCIVKCIQHIDKLKPYVKKFFSSTIINDYVSREIAVAICSSDNAIRIMKQCKDACFTTDKNYGVIAIECAAIPKGSKNIDNAYKFLDYILRPDIAKIITDNGGLFMNTIDTSDTKFFTRQDVHDFHFLRPSVTQYAINCDKICNRLWIKAITNKGSISISGKDMYLEDR